MAHFDGDDYLGKILFGLIEQHFGHNIEIARYGDPTYCTNLSIECMDCWEVIIDVDRPQEDNHGTAR